MKIIRYALLSAAPIFLNSCVAAWITQIGKSDASPKTRAEAVSAYGQPAMSGIVGRKVPLPVSLDPDERTGLRTYEIYTYRGLMRDSRFGSAAATANAVSLGTSEAISIPFAVLNRVTGVAKTHWFFAGYAGTDQIVLFKKVDYDPVTKASQRRGH